MTKKEKAVSITKILEKLYPNPAIPLNHKDEYTLLIAVLLSAQCTDVRVNQITPCASAPPRLLCQHRHGGELDSTEVLKPRVRATGS